MRLPHAIIITPDRKLQQTIRDALPMQLVRAESFSSAEECLAINPWDRAALLIAEMDQIGMSGLTLLERLRTARHQLPVAMITGESNIADTIRAYDMGVARVLLKPIDIESLLTTVSNAVARFNALEVDEFQPERALLSLSPREREVLELLLADKPTRQIARELAISPSTVEKHRAKVLTKMQVHSVVGLALRYYRACHPSTPAPHFLRAQTGVRP
jgi:two-component system CheB/CheR fusion protein